MAASSVHLLLVKTSSMGDLVHTLSALEEAKAHCPGLRVDWVCESAFTEIAQLSSAVVRVIPCAQRRWKKNWWSAASKAERKAFISSLRQEEYDLVIDAQGLIKSAWITFKARCRSKSKWGYDWASAREPLASLVVNQKISAPASLHAIVRLRLLLGAALGYPLESSTRWLPGSAPANTDVLFLHGSSRTEKLWPVQAWAELGRRLVAKGIRVLIPWGSEQEHQAAHEMARAIGSGAQVLPEMSLGSLITLVRGAAGCVGVDSGLMHLSVVLGRPTVAVMSAAHLPHFAATRFAPFWAPHARVVSGTKAQPEISVDEVMLQCDDLFLRTEGR